MAVGVAFLAGVYLLRMALPQTVREAFPTYQRREWMRSVLPLILIAGMNTANSRADVLMLGAIAGAEAVGIYNVANRGTQFIIFIQIAINLALAPTISSLYAAGNLQRLQLLITKSQRWSLVFSLAIAGSFILFGNEFLSLFGKDFQQGYMILVISSIGWAINAACGGVAGHVLVMTGYERGTAIGIGATVVLNIILNSVLIPRWGAQGAAISVAITMVVRNLLLTLWVYRKVGIDSTALGRSRLSTSSHADSNIIAP
jgi:O-antigen/teichoic acid export membrane protein